MAKFVAIGYSPSKARYRLGALVRQMRWPKAINLVLILKINISSAVQFLQRIIEE